MTHKKRTKSSRMRGSRSHGGGHKKKRRGGGSRGGRGYAGSHKAKFSYITTKEPFHYGYKGFASLKSKDIIINVGQIELLITKNNITEKEIDLSKFGYTKLLGNGEIKSALNIKVLRFSSSAKDKMEKAGGKVVPLFETATKQVASNDENKTKQEEPSKK
ncbi:uL15 family ribosomal protein [Candidatus Aenigmatarchaeota archaeon]